MKRIVILFLCVLPFLAVAQPFSPAEISQWKQQAQQVTIIRDNWGIPHIYGKTDAEAVFGSHSALVGCYVQQTSSQNRLGLASGSTAPKVIERFLSYYPPPPFQSVQTHSTI
jgi:hypothetical protein